MLQRRTAKSVSFFSSLRLVEGFTDIWNVFKSIILSSLGDGWGGA